MASVFTWLDYSEHEQRKMLNVISALRETDTRDELGIGIVRDALKSILTPVRRPCPTARSTAG